MVYFVGAGPGAVDLITVRGAELIKHAGMIVYAGSLVNPEILNKYASENCEFYDSSGMSLDKIIEKLIDGHSRGILTVRLHSGDPSLFGAIREQMRCLSENGIPFEVIPGVSSFCAAAASLKTEYTIPEISQSVIISRLGGRTTVPSSENISSLAAHNASMVLFLSAGMADRLCDELISGGYSPDTPAALVYRASWPDEQIIKGTLKDLPGLADRAGIKKTALILVGKFLEEPDMGELDKKKEATKIIINTNSKLYDKNFSHGFRN